MPRGGKQPGAGRPKGAVAKSTAEAMAAKAYMIERITTELDPILTALINNALTGDMAAIKECLDRAFGKAKETVEHGGNINFEFLKNASTEELRQIIARTGKEIS